MSRWLDNSVLVGAFRRCFTDGTGKLHPQGVRRPGEPPFSPVLGGNHAFFRFFAPGGTASGLIWSFFERTRLRLAYFGTFWNGRHRVRSFQGFFAPGGVPFDAFGSFLERAAARLEFLRAFFSGRGGVRTFGRHFFPGAAVSGSFSGLNRLNPQPH
jgi:hypothetical protein